jgi:Flp pilus assembly protein TadG
MRVVTAISGAFEVPRFGPRVRAGGWPACVAACQSFEPNGGMVIAKFLSTRNLRTIAKRGFNSAAHDADKWRGGPRPEDWLPMCRPINAVKIRIFVQSIFNIFRDHFAEKFSTRRGVMNISAVFPVRRFLRDTRGSLTPIFVVVLPVLLGLTGMAVDYTRAGTAKIRLQSALDATALAMSANAPSLSASDLTAQANAYFSALLPATSGFSPSISISYSTNNGGQVVVTGSATLNTYFLGLPPVNTSSLNISGTSTTAWGNSRLRVALVLDNTGSMADSGKITALRTATKNLLTQLKNAAVNNGDVYVSIIPFVKDVNVGSTYNNANWID